MSERFAAAASSTSAQLIAEIGNLLRDSGATPMQMLAGGILVPSLVHAVQRESALELSTRQMSVVDRYYDLERAQLELYAWAREQWPDAPQDPVALTAFVRRQCRRFFPNAEGGRDDGTPAAR